jgi:hypothetical protein
VTRPVLVRLVLVALLLGLPPAAVLAAWLPALARAKERRETAACLRARLTGVPGAACPDGARRIPADRICPSPKGHGGAETRVLRRPDGTALIQEHPALPGPELASAGVVVRLDGPRARVVNRGWIRWALVPALLVVAFAFGVASMVYNLAVARQDLGASAFGLIVQLALIAAALGYAHREIAFEVDAPRGRLTRTVTAFGVELRREVHEGLLAVAALPSGAVHTVAAILREGEAVEMFDVPAAWRGAAAALNAALR